MKRLFLVSTVVSMMMTTSPAQVKRYDVKDFFRNPEKTRFQISPDGNYYSYLAPWENRMNIYVQKTGEKEPVRVTNVKDRDIAGYFWKDNTLLYVRDFGGDENYHVFMASVDGKSEKDLTPFKDVRVSITDDLFELPGFILVEMNKENPEVFDVYRLNITTGDLQLVAKNPGNISTWVADHEGRIRAAVTTDGVSSSLMVRSDEKAEWKSLITTNFRESVYPLFFSFDNASLYVSTNLKRDKSVIARINLEKGTEEEVLYENDQVDVSDLNYSRLRKVLTYAEYETDKTYRHYFDKETEVMFNKIQENLPGKTFAISANDKNEKRFIVRSYSDRSLGAYYLYDKNSGKLEMIHNISPWINESDMAEMKPVSFTSKDGVKIHGYLTLPVGKPATNLPVVINPHGGPWARDSWGYNPEVQFLANRGYAVFQINFRGSTGYGRKFWELSFKQWGQTMQQDITDGVNWLISQKIANPSKIAIYGASYGGYATLAGITGTPDLYAAAIDYVGVSNLFTFMKTIPPYWKPYLEMMYEMVGNPEDARDSLMMRKYSPVFQVDKIKTPLLIAQGAKDPRVNKNESDQIVEALKKRGIDVEYIVKENEGHGFHNEENRFEFYSAMEKFLGKHLN